MKKVFSRGLPAKKSPGLYQKYIVTRTDGTDRPGGKHDGCGHFVLDVDCDPHALPALEAYADSCEEDYPQLASDLRRAVTFKRMEMAKPKSE